jgi:hypothetical protein
MNEILLTAIGDLLRQLETLLLSLTDEQYNKKLCVLSDATLGQHTRHILEFFLELSGGYQTGCVNYDDRKRDYEIEVNRTSAAKQIDALASLLNKQDKALTLIADYGKDKECSIRVSTNYQRELVYNLEHMVHHMALIRIGVHAQSGIGLPEDFGVALSTIKYRKTCVQ